MTYEFQKWLFRFKGWSRIFKNDLRPSRITYEWLESFKNNLSILNNDPRASGIIFQTKNDLRASTNASNKYKTLTSNIKLYTKFWSQEYNKRQNINVNNKMETKTFSYILCSRSQAHAMVSQVKILFDLHQGQVLEISRHYSIFIEKLKP